MDTAGKSAGRGALLILGAAQFVMVVDSTVMNVSLTRVVADLHTTIVGMQTAITMFTLVMAAFMLTGGKLGVRWGTRRAFVIGLIVYGIGSMITALSPNLGVLLFGWSLLEGLGAILVMPAIIALIGSTFSGQARAAAFGLIGGVAGAAAAAGPLIGGWVTQVATWRYVFATETLVCILILFFIKLLNGSEPDKSSRLDAVGVLLSASGLGIAVYGILQSSAWGLLQAKPAAPFAPLGMSPSILCILAGVALLAAFAWWERRVARGEGEPLVHEDLLRTERLRGGLGTLASLQFLIAGTFFILPLYLQTMLGLDSLQTGIRIMPLSIALLVAALAGAGLASRFSPRRVCQAGLLIALAGQVGLIAALHPTLSGALFAVSLAVFGAGAGFVMSQIGAINLSGIPTEQGGEVGGMQGTAQNLGFSLGTAIVGALLLASLASGFTRFAAQQPALAGVMPQLEQAASKGTNFLSASQVEEAAAAKTTPEETNAIVASYEQAQLTSLKLGCALIALVALGGLWFARKVPLALASEEDEGASIAATQT